MCCFEQMEKQVCKAAILCTPGGINVVVDVHFCSFSFSYRFNLIRLMRLGKVQINLYETGKDEVRCGVMQCTLMEGDVKDASRCKI